MLEEETPTKQNTSPDPKIGFIGSLSEETRYIKETFNDHTIGLSNLQTAYIDQSIYLKEISSRVRHWREGSSLQEQKDSYNMAYAELLKPQKTVGSNRAGSSVDSMIKDIPRTYL